MGENPATSTPPGFDAAQLVKTHQAGVWRYLRALGCPAPLADDLTQETFLYVLQRPFRDVNPAATGTYLRKVARSLFITAQRRRARDIQQADWEKAGITLAELEDAFLDQFDAAWAQWGEAGDPSGEGTLSALRHCLETLTDRARQALTLRFHDQLSRQDIATTLGMSEDGAKNLMQRAKKQLKSCIEARLKT